LAWTYTASTPSGFILETFAARSATWPRWAQSMKERGVLEPLIVAPGLDEVIP
jgi:hypothetical protein